MKPTLVPTLLCCALILAAMIEAPSINHGVKMYEKQMYGRPIRALPEGTSVARYVQALARSRGSLATAAKMAEQWVSTPGVALSLKSAATIGTTHDGSYDSLVAYGISTELITLLRGASVLGKISASMRAVPFRTKIVRELAAGTFGWVGQSKPIPASKGSFDLLALEPTKPCGIVVLSDELTKVSSPNAEAAILAQLVASIAAFLDRAFLDPSLTAVADVSPASITNGAPTINSTGSTAAQILADLLSMLATRATGWVSPFFIMAPATALSLIGKFNTAGARAFPDVTPLPTGGKLLGIPVLLSSNVPGAPGSPTSGNASITLLEASDLLLADDGKLTFDASSQASLQMTDTPADAAANMTSLFQCSCIGVKCIREIAWARAHEDAVVSMLVNY